MLFILIKSHPQRLRAEGMPKVAPYHAGLRDDVRESTLRRWTANELHVIVATVGMCIGWGWGLILFMWCIVIVRVQSIVNVHARLRDDVRESTLR